jgi:hypothetical protein
MERCDVAGYQDSGECAHEGHSEGTHVFLLRQSFTGPLDDRLDRHSRWQSLPIPRMSTEVVEPWATS